MAEDDTPAPTITRPKRMTLSEVLEHLLARSSSDRSSVSLTRNAKGETQIEVVVRTTDAGEVTTAEEAASRAVELYDTLRGRYPMADGYSAKPGSVASSESKPGQSQERGR